MEQQRYEVKVAGVYLHEEDKIKGVQHFVLLRDDADRRLQIWMGQYEAWGISFGLDGKPVERPMTHDMIILLMEATGAKVAEAVIRDVQNELFYADLTLRLPTGEEKTLDIRPSDAIAVALRAKCPIFVAEHVMVIAAKSP
jgi:bifunctional DNase/RNase